MHSAVSRGVRSVTWLARVHIDRTSTCLAGTGGPPAFGGGAGAPGRAVEAAATVDSAARGALAIPRGFASASDAGVAPHASDEGATPAPADPKHAILERICSKVSKVLKKDVTPALLSKDDIAKALIVKDLKDACREAKLMVGGNKNVLIERLMSYLSMDAMGSADPKHAILERICSKASKVLKKDVTPALLSKDDIAKALIVKDLKDACGEAKLMVGGTKHVLIERLMSYLGMDAMGSAAGKATTAQPPAPKVECPECPEGEKTWDHLLPKDGKLREYTDVKFRAVVEELAKDNFSDAADFVKYCLKYKLNDLSEEMIGGDRALIRSHMRGAIRDLIAAKGVKGVSGNSRSKSKGEGEGEGEGGGGGEVAEPVAPKKSRRKVQEKVTVSMINRSMDKNMAGALMLLMGAKPPQAKADICKALATFIAELTKQEKGAAALKEARAAREREAAAAAAAAEQRARDVAAAASRRLAKVVWGQLMSAGSQNLVRIPVHEKCDFTDELIIATVGSRGRVADVAGGIKKQVMDATGRVPKVEGMGSDWVMVDGLNFMVHVMTEDARNYYDLDGLWGGDDLQDVIESGDWDEAPGALQTL